MTFKSNKNSEELGIDLKRKFVIVKKLKGSNKGFTSDCKIGDILQIKEDDKTNCPFFWNLTKYPNKEDYVVCDWSVLDYYKKTKKINNKSKVKILKVLSNKKIAVKMVPKKQNKWNNVIGCLCFFKKDGKLYIVKNAKIISQIKNELTNTFKVVETEKNILISDGFSVSKVFKKYCKII